jgi:class 3 adenylate cyclase
LKDENKLEMDQDKDLERKQASQSDEAKLLKLSYLEFIGMATVTVYVRITGKEDQPYTIVGAPVDLPRHIAAAH